MSPMATKVKLSSPARAGADAVPAQAATASATMPAPKNQADNRTALGSI